ncbi:MAG: MCE family protein [Candidatus Eremiobacteraeota bacterium]|nr:MCE family protein [Candidatus Eremiobacteraeota bacterium]
MSREARVGIFAILALLVLFGIFFEITDFVTRHRGYRIGVHFDSAAGLRPGAVIYFSGVGVGTVDSIVLLPDNTVDVILAINQDISVPNNSKFLIQAPLTGDPSLLIVPPVPPRRAPGEIGPTPAPTAVPVLAREILPIDEQPRGENAASINDLLQQGQGEVKRLDVMLADLETHEPKLLATLQDTLQNADRLTSTMNSSVSGLATSLGTVGDNMVALTGSLNSTVQGNTSKIDSLLSSLDATAVALNESVDQLRTLAKNPAVKQNLIDTTKNIAETTATIAGLTADLRQVTGNPATQAQMRDTVANLDATMQKANSLLGSLGGTSNVYGIDTGATPYPSPPPGASPVPLPFPPAQPSPFPHSGGVTGGFHQGLGSYVRNLYALQFRFSGLSKQNVVGPSPILTGDRGPQTDFNVILLPLSSVSLFAGANDIGTSTTTWNLAAVQRMAPGVHLGLGVLYSQFGVLGSFYEPHEKVGLEARLYDPRTPTLDAYLNAKVTPFSKLFLGGRDLTHPDRRFVYGLQLQF